MPNEFTEEGYPACVGCGYCCNKVTCPPGRWLAPESHSENDKCYFLEKDGLVHRCGLITQSSGTLRKALEWHLAIGAGCSSSMFNNYRDEIIRKQREEENG